MRWSFRTAVGAALLAFVALGVPSGAQQPASQPPPDAGAPPAQPPASQGDQQQPQPTFRAGINFVRLDVIISAKNGSPIEDLKQSDFQVYEDGKPQAIQTFKLIELNGGTVPEPGSDGPPRPIRTDQDEATEAARDDVRVFAVFLDDYHVRRESSMRVREMLADFVASKLGPSDMIGLMYPLQPLGTVRLTRDHDAVERGLMDFTGRKYNYEPTNDFEQRYVMYSPETVERIRNDVSLSALEALIVHLGGLKEGRKSLLLVSEGYTNMLPPQLRGDGATPAIVGVDPLSPGADPLAGQNDPIEERASWYASNEMQDQLRYIWDVANKNNVSIYAIDPRGLATSEFDIKDNVGQQLGNDYLHTTQDTLRTLAEETDGRAIINSNDLTPGLNQIVRDSSAYYLLGYDSAAAPTDGKFHKIEVRVNRPGVQVRARQGYWAITKENAERVLAPAKPGPPPGVSKALAVVAEPLRERVIQSWIGTSRGDAGKTRVSFVWQAAPRPGARNEDAPAAVTLMALGDDGTPLYRGRVPSTTPAPGTGTAAGPGRVSFDVPPGLMHLRITVESADQGTLDSEIRDVDVPDLATADAVLGTPVVYRARTARQMADLKSASDPVPAIGHAFNRAERLLIRVPIYGAAPPLSARLLNQAGNAIEDVAVEAPAAASAAQIELPLASLAPGDYVLEISAKADPDPIVQYVGFRVGG